ncbi:protein rolling stone-like [Haliotis rubra]|uniref:protein rolling stone-like n=1 Tax=Haliotis rubra TaxID=36100 RepID=UPI001EE529CD|nr:protein rolling stone-like [Haliotis rubra]
MGIKEIFAEEFSSTSFLLDYKYPGRFVRFECGYPKLYAAWRFIWMLYNIAAIISSGLLEKYYASSPDNRWKWLIFLTNWTFVVLTVGCIVDFFTTVFVQWGYPQLLEEKEEESLPWYLKLVWVLSNIYNAVSLMVTVGYWGFGTFDPTKGLSGPRALPFLGHGMNSIYVICNICVTAMPVRLFHLWQPLVFTVIYGTFNIIYIAAGATDDTNKPYIYPPIDWRKNPVQTEAIGLAVVFGVIFAHMVIFFLHLARRGIVHVWRCRSPAEEEESTAAKIKSSSDAYGSTHTTNNL